MLLQYMQEGDLWDEDENNQMGDEDDDAAPDLVGDERQLDNLAGRAAAAPAAAEALRIHDDGRWHFMTADHTEVGWLHHLGGNSIKATCKLHKSCTCVISLPNEGSRRAEKLGGIPSFDVIAADLVGWLDAGLDVEHNEHMNLATTLKKDKWHMQVRKKDG